MPQVAGSSRLAALTGSLAMRSHAAKSERKLTLVDKPGRSPVPSPAAIVHSAQARSATPLVSAMLYGGFDLWDVVVWDAGLSDTARTGGHETSDTGTCSLRTAAGGLALRSELTYLPVR